MQIPNAIESSVNFLPLMIVLVLAFFVPILLSRLRQLPIVVGEILAGLLVGSSILGWVQEETILSLMSNIGLAFLMFLAGLEIDFERLFGQQQEEKESGPGMLVRSVIVYILTVLLAGIGAMILKASGMQANPWLLAFIFSATSLGVLLPVLKERGLTRTRFGQVVFLSATLADFFTVILLTVFLIIKERGLDLEIFSIGLLFIFFFAAYRLGLRFTQVPGVRRVVEELSRATVQIKVRGAIAILMIFVVLAQVVNAELILGAFLAGMVISLIKSHQDEGLVHNLEAFGFGFFIPVFFIMVGVNLDLRSLMESPQDLLLLPIFLLISMVVKLIPVIGFKRYLSWKELLAGGVLLNTHLSLEIAVAVVGAQAGLLNPAAAAIITLFAVLTVIVMPLLFAWLAPEPASSRPKLIAICGSGSEALEIARELKQHGEQVCILNEDIAFSTQAQKAGFDAVHTSQEEMKHILDPTGLKGLIALSPDDELNLEICKAARAAGISPVIARVNDAARIPQFKQTGIQPFVPTLSQTILLAMMVRNPDAFTLLTAATEDREVRELSLRNRSMIGRRLAELRLPGESLVLSIRRGVEFIIPHGNVQLDYQDQLTLLGCPDDLDEMASLLGQ